jgi:phosphatidylinositol alpha-1,6-mannosyltransferase
MERVLMLGRLNRLERYKGHDQVLDAWPRVIADRPSATLVIVGEGDDLDRLRLKSRGVPGVAFSGFVEAVRLRGLLRDSRLLAAPSTNEGFGLNAVEAAMQGTPVLGLRGSVLEELFPGGEAELIATHDPAAVGDGILRLITNSELAQRKALEARARALACFTDDQAVTRIRTALQNWIA